MIPPHAWCLEAKGTVTASREHLSFISVEIFRQYLVLFCSMFSSSVLEIMRTKWFHATSGYLIYPDQNISGFSILTTICEK